MPKLYLAARFSRREELTDYARQLEAAGWEVTSRWLGQSTPSNGLMSNCSAEENQTYAECDLEDVATADGLAVVGPRENIFHWLLPDYAMHESIEALLATEKDKAFYAIHHA